MHLLLVLLAFSVALASSRLARPLGGYERLLSRKTPGQSSVSLSHGCAFILSGSESVDESKLLVAVSRAMRRHPMLRTYIDVDPASGLQSWAYCEASEEDLAKQVVRTVRVSDDDSEGILFTQTWQEELQRSLNQAVFPERGPLWKLCNIVVSPKEEAQNSNNKKQTQSAWVFCVNHGADDQQSMNILVKYLLHEYTSMNSMRSGQNQRVNADFLEPLPFPPSCEEAVAPSLPNFKTFAWSIFQLCNSLLGPKMAPQKLFAGIKENPAAFTKHVNPDERETFCEFFTLPSGTTDNLRKTCRAQGVTVTSALAAAMLSVTAAATQVLGGAKSMNTESAESTIKNSLLRFLLSVDLRPFGVEATSDWAKGTVACAAGAVDFAVPVSASIASKGDVTTPFVADSTSTSTSEMWELAKQCGEKAAYIIEKQGWVPESVRLFGFGMQYADILRVVEMEAKNAGSLGRGYSCGVSNMGLVKFTTSDDSNNAPTLGVSQAFYGTSHGRNGVLCQLSCMTVGGENAPFCGCLQFTSPLISKEEAKQIAMRLVKLVEQLAASKSN